MTQIRVVLIGLPPLLADLICELAREHSDLDVAVLPMSVAPLDAVARTSADVLIAVVGNDSIPGMPAVLERFPRLRTIVLLEHGRRAVLYELAPRTATLRDISPQTLLDAIKTPADWTFNPPAGEQRRRP